MTILYCIFLVVIMSTYKKETLKNDLEMKGSKRS